MKVWVHCILYVFFIIGLHARTVYLIPCEGMNEEGMLFSNARDEVTKPFIVLKKSLEEAGYEVRFIQEGMHAQDATAIISFGAFGFDLTEYPRERCFLFSFEPPVVDSRCYSDWLTRNFGKVFILPQDYVDNIHFFKFYYPQPRQSMVESQILFEDKKLCALICANKSSSHPQSLYYARRDVVDFFERLGNGKLDLYGPWWDGRPLWKGTIPNKWEVLKRYKFSFCYENMHSQRGYITEKIFDSMVAGCVPIYLGASDITDYIPAECFIDRRAFFSNKDLYRFLEEMDETTHEGYLQAIRRYFDSPEAQLFSIKNFVDLIKEELNKLN